MKLQAFLRGLLLLALLMLVSVGAAQETIQGVTTDGVNVRASPARNGAQLSAFAFNTTIIVEARNDASTWLLVRTPDGGVRGWVSAQFVRLTNGAVPNLPVSGEVIGASAAPSSGGDTGAAAPSSTTAQVRGANLNVRDTPSTRGNRIGAVNAGTEVTIIGRNERGDWAFVAFSGTQGWVSARYLRLPRGTTLASFPVVSQTGTAAAAAPSGAPPAPVEGAAAPPAADASTNYIIMPEQVLITSRSVFQLGQRLGRRHDVFIKVGDSNMLQAEYLCTFQGGNYNLGNYGHLQGIINTFAGTGSFCNVDPSTGTGFTTPSLVDNFFLSDPNCQVDEVPISCALRLRQPAFALIYIGVLDMNYITSQAFEQNIGNIVYYFKERGVVPILSTFTIDAWRDDGRPAFYNAAIRRVATNQRVPLIDLQAAVAGYPQRGTREDGFHLSSKDGGAFTPFTGEENQYGRTKRELMTLELLNSLYWYVTR
jgi:uncharacterized protein YraI